MSCKERLSRAVGAVESRSILVKDREFIVRVQCDECGGSAHFVTQSPHPLHGLQIRTFECLECRFQTQRIVQNRRSGAADFGMNANRPVAAGRKAKISYAR